MHRSLFNFDGAWKSSIKTLVGKFYELRLCVVHRGSLLDARVRHRESLLEQPSRSYLPNNFESRDQMVAVLLHMARGRNDAESLFTNCGGRMIDSLDVYAPVLQLHVGSLFG